MIDVGRELARAALDDAFCRLLSAQVGAALRWRDEDKLRLDVHELCEAHGRASRAIDRNFAG